MLPTYFVKIVTLNQNYRIHIPSLISSTSKEKELVLASSLNWNIWMKSPKKAFLSEFLSAWFSQALRK